MSARMLTIVRFPHHDDQDSDLDDFNEETEVSSDGDRRKKSRQ